MRIARSASGTDAFRIYMALALVAALILALIPLAGPAGAVGTFDDDDGNIHESAIEQIAAADITRGCNPPANTLYCPDDDVDRGQMAAFLRRLLELPASSTDFFDDDDGSVFEGDINAIAAAGVTKGCNPPANNLYCPDDDVSRGEMAAFIRRALELDGSSDDFFSDDDTSVFEGDINAIARIGITRGCNPPDNTEYCPDRPIPRDEMATFLARSLDVLTTGTTVTTSPTPTTTPPSSTTTTVPGQACTEDNPITPATVPLTFSNGFSTDRGGLCDSNAVGTGFTIVDEPSNGSGYLRDRLTVAGGQLRIRTTSGLMVNNTNSQDNALAVGMPLPVDPLVIRTSIVDPGGSGAFEQAGIWFGNDERDHLKLVVLSLPAGPRIQMRVEDDDELYTQGGNQVITTAIPDPSSSTVELEMTADPTTNTATGRYRIDNGAWQNVGTVDVPVCFFTCDQAGVGALGTDTFAGIFASHRDGSPMTFRFDSFSVSEAAPPPPPPGGDVEFDAVRNGIGFRPTSLVRHTGNIYFALENDGTIHRFTVNPTSGNVNVTDSIEALKDKHGNDLLTLGITKDPDPDTGRLTLWVTHAVGEGRNAGGGGEPGVKNSAKVSKIEWPATGLPDAGDITDVITGLPRAFANHSINSLHFGPDGRLYIANGGQTGAGGANTADTEFSTRPEQYYSSALLVADVKDPGWSLSGDGNCATDVGNDIDATGVAQLTPAPNCSVELYATGFRNMYDFVHHSNGSIYGPDNALGVEGTVPPETSHDCRGIVEYDEPGPDPLDPAADGPLPDRLHRIEEGRYYGHPNPARKECVFFDGSFQGTSPLSTFEEDILQWSTTTRSYNGIIEYQDDAFDNALQTDLLITNFAGGQRGVRRVEFAQNNPANVVNDEFVTVNFASGGWNDPLPIVEGPNGIVIVGEFRERDIVVLLPNE